MRWSWPKAWFSLGGGAGISTVTLSVQFPPPVVADYHPSLRVFVRRGKTPEKLLGSPPVAVVEDYRAGPFTIRLAAPTGSGNLWIGWTLNGVNLARAGVSGDNRDMGLKISWVGLTHTRD